MGPRRGAPGPTPTASRHSFSPGYPGAPGIFVGAPSRDGERSEALHAAGGEECVLGGAAGSGPGMSPGGEEGWAGAAGAPGRARQGGPHGPVRAHGAEAEGQLRVSGLGRGVLGRHRGWDQGPGWGRPRGQASDTIISFSFKLACCRRRRSSRAVGRRLDR